MALQIKKLTINGRVTRSDDRDTAAMAQLSAQQIKRLRKEIMDDCRRMIRLQTRRAQDR